MADKQQAQRTPAIFEKSRGRIIEEIAITGVLQAISDGEGIPLPESWLQEADRLRESIYKWIDSESRNERLNR